MGLGRKKPKIHFRRPRDVCRWTFVDAVFALRHHYRCTTYVMLRYAFTYPSERARTINPINAMRRPDGGSDTQIAKLAFSSGPPPRVPDIIYVRDNGRGRSSNEIALQWTNGFRADVAFETWMSNATEETTFFCLLSSENLCAVNVTVITIPMLYCTDSPRRCFIERRTFHYARLLGNSKNPH